MSIKENVTEAKNCKTIRYLFCAAFFSVLTIFALPSTSHAAENISNVVATCSADGNNVTISWDPADGITQYATSIDNIPNNAPACLEGWVCDGSDLKIFNTPTNPYSFPVISGNDYSYYIYGIPGGGDSKGTFNCTVDCNANSNHESCLGSDDYCNLNPDNKLEPVCTEGDPAYCALAHHANEPKCKVGEEEFCKLQHNKVNPACIVGNPIFCKLPQHNNHPECPGTVSYCTKYPQATLCGAKPIDPPCVAAGNCTTPYQVNMTTKSTAIGTVLCTGVYYIKSDFGRGLAILAVLILGMYIWAGKATWVYATLVGLGITAIFSAAELAVYIATNVSTMGGTLACLVGI